MNFLPRAVKFLPNCALTLNSTTINLKPKVRTQSGQSGEQQQHESNTSPKESISPLTKATIYSVILLGSIAGSYYYYGYKNPKIEKISIAHLLLCRDLPFYEHADVQKHDSVERGVWIAYGLGVYDITNYVMLQKGGTILTNKGPNFEKFWISFTKDHKDSMFVELEKYRIGNILPDEV